MNRAYLAFTVAVLALPAAARADVILTFGQTSPGNTITATANGAGTATTITANDVPVDVTQILGGAPTTALFDLSITSTDAAQPLGGGGFQHYAGTFSILDGATNLLSGTFSDILLGSGTSGVLAAGAPPDTITFTSDVISVLDLARSPSVSPTSRPRSPSMAIPSARSPAASPGPSAPMPSLSRARSVCSV